MYYSNYYYGNPYRLNFSRSYPRAAAYNFSGENVRVTRPDGTVLSADDIRYINKKKVYGTNEWALIPSSIFIIPGVSGLANTGLNGSPLGGGVSRGAAVAAGVLSGTRLAPLAPVASAVSNVAGVVDLDREQQARQKAGTDYEIPDPEDYHYMNAALRYDGSFGGRHPVFGTIISNPVAMDLTRGIQPRGRALKYAAATIAPAALGLTADLARTGSLGVGTILGGLGTGLGLLAGPFLYNSRGRKKYLREKEARRAAGRMY